MLNQEEIAKLIKENKLIEGFIDLNTQLTPNGFDLTAANIFEFDGAGAADFSNKERRLPKCREIFPEKQKQEDEYGWWVLKKGVYKVKTNETVNLSNGLTAQGFTRTSLLRMGAFTAHGVWDAGFNGRSEFILAVENPFGIKLKRNARVVQLVFFCINRAPQGYNGIYQNKD